MAKKFLYVESTGFYTESNAYETADFINASTGVADADKPIKTDATGKLDASFIDINDIYPMISWQNDVIDRVTTPPGSPSEGDRYLVIATGTGDFAGQEDKIAQYIGGSWVFTTPSTGYAVIVNDELDGVYIYGGSSWSKQYWEATTASTGLTKVGFDVRLADAVTNDGINVTSGAITIVHDGQGLQFVSEELALELDGSTLSKSASGLKVAAAGITEVELNASVAGDGLAGGAGTPLSVNVDNVTIEINADTLRVKADGINDTHIDFGTGVNQVNAADLPIIDTMNYFTSTDVEGALAELYNQNSNPEYTVGVGGVTKGDLVYISANDTVNTYSTITTSQYGIGLAQATVAAAGQVNVAADDTILTGVLTGATAGTVYYWNGTTLTSTLPTGGGAYVWRVGVAKNSSDLHVGCEFIKKNN